MLPNNTYQILVVGREIAFLGREIAFFLIVCLFLSCYDVLGRLKPYFRRI